MKSQYVVFIVYDGVRPYIRITTVGRNITGDVFKFRISTEVVS